MARMKQISIDVEVSRVVESNRNSFSESENDILRRLLLVLSPSAKSPPAVTAMHPQATKRRGAWSFFLEGNEIRTANMKDAYCKMLLMLAERDPNFLQLFSQLRSRSRRYVATDKRSLFEASPHLANDFAAELSPGWFVDTNLSKQQVSKRARAAAETAGLKYGSGMRIAEAGRTV